ncbi:MAG: Wzz/FepE/Etk N-terminal domain-containing protein, partial [Acidimicrobiales bacterium]
MSARMPNSEHAGLEPTILTAIRRAWVLVLALVVLGAALGLLYTKLVAKTYHAQAGIVIAPPPASLAATGASGSGAGAASSFDYVNEQVALLQSPDVVARAASTVNRELPGANLSAADLASGLTVTPPVSSPQQASSSTSNASNSTLVGVTLRGPRMAADAANAVLAAYQQTYESQVRSQAQTTISGIGQSVSAVTASLTSVTSQLAAIQKAQAATEAAQQQQAQQALNNGQRVAPPATPIPNAQAQSLQTQQSSLATHLT